MATYTSTASGNLKRWSKDEDSLLIHLATSTTKTWKEISNEMVGRTHLSVKRRSEFLKIKRDKLALSARFAKDQRDRFDAKCITPKDINVWKRRCLSRDNYTCQDCKLHDPSICTVHHIVPKTVDPKLKFETSNGITLCPNCHAKVHHKMGRKTSGNRLSKAEKDYVYLSLQNGKSKSEISTMLGVNIKTVDSLVKRSAWQR
jgi:hypothetical protein